METTKSRIHYQIYSSLAGFISGYVLLHPVSMIIFRYLDPVYRHQYSTQHSTDPWRPIFHSFHLEMVPMSLLFGLIGMVIILTAEHYHRNLRIQRNRLANQLEENQLYRKKLEAKSAELQKQNQKLIELERENRRSTHFMIHDFKTNLNCILGYSQLMIEQISEDLVDRNQLSGNLHRIYRQANYISEEINNLLAYSNLQKKQIKVEETTVEEIVDSIFQHFSLPVQLNRILFEENMDRSLKVICDFHIIQRVMINLISNVFKHNSDNTKICIDISKSESNQEIIFNCQDDGKGILKDIQPDIFKDYSHTNSKRTSDSTGLGLAF